MKTTNEMKMINILKLIPYANNARTHSDEQIMKLRSSLREFGFVNPVLVDKDNNIIAGHGRIMAAKAEGIEEVPCVLVEHLTEAQKKAYILADNRLAEDAGWDMELVDLELDTLREMDFDISLTGFEMDELSFDMADDKEVEEDDFDVDGVLDEIVEPISKRGDIWQLGKHRLKCGDSTIKDDVDRLMNGGKADMVFTDPPYNVAFNGRSGKFDVIKNDNLNDVEFNRFIDGFLESINYINANTYYICCNWAFYGIMQLKLKPKACIVWAKNIFGLGKGYRHQHEFILFDGLIDPDIKNESDLWQVKKATNYVHPTQKPIELPARAINNSTKINNRIVDLFGGSGSTLIAAEQLNRICYMMELDEKYCDVIIKRWETLTGNKAELIEG